MENWLSYNCKNAHLNQQILLLFIGTKVRYEMESNPLFTTLGVVWYQYWIWMTIFLVLCEGSMPDVADTKRLVILFILKVAWDSFLELLEELENDLWSMWRYWCKCLPLILN